VAIDLTPLIGARTGIGQLVAELVDALAARSADDLELRGYALTWRGRGGLAAAAAGLSTGRPLPARLCRTAWARLDHPTVRLLAGRVDVVHGTNYVVPPGGGAAELVSVHDLTAWHWPELVHPDSLAYPPLVARAVRRGAHVHAISQFVADEIVDAMRLPPERVHVVRPGLTTLPPGDAERGRAAAGTDDYLLAVGTVEPRKDYPALVEALARLEATHPGTRLVIAGGEGWGSDALDAAIGRTGTTDRVTRLGYVTTGAKADLLAGARALVYPSRYEGFGLVPLEAMAAGVPVITTRAGAVPEVVGDAAELCEPGDPDGLAAAIGRVLDDDTRRASLVAAGYQRALEFRWSDAADRLAELYRALTDR
jgi:glycosyltransferase involved in cell wall biosynthesis